MTKRKAKEVVEFEVRLSGVKLRLTSITTSFVTEFTLEVDDYEFEGEVEPKRYRLTNQEVLMLGILFEGAFH